MADDTVQPKLLPIEEFIESGLKTRLQETFGANVIFGNASNKIQVLKRLAADKGGTVQYPFFFLSVASSGVNKEGYKAHSMAKRGLVLPLVSPQGDFTYELKILPVDTVYDVEYYDNDFNRILKMRKTWLFSSQLGTLKFSVQYGRSFDISVLMEENVTLPKREADPTNISEYEPLTTQLTVKGYLSMDRPIVRPLVKSVEVEIATAENPPNVVSTALMSFNIKRGQTS